MTMATISNHDGSCRTRVCLVDGKWVPRSEIIAKTSERIVGLLSEGAKTRRYLGRTIGGDPRIIDGALISLAQSGRVAVSVGVGCRVRAWTIIENEVQR
jgi:hypothetical protein